VIDVAARADASTETILDEVRRHANGDGLQDDATVILVKASGD
jgi:hypothetical protein